MGQTKNDYLSKIYQVGLNEQKSVTIFRTIGLILCTINLHVKQFKSNIMVSISF